MGTQLVVASAFAAVNLLMLASLAVVWGRNYRTFGSSLVLGLLAFSVVLALENAVALYFFFSMRMLYASDPTVQTVVATMRGLQFVALVFLTYVTWK